MTLDQLGERLGRRRAYELVRSLTKKQVFTRIGRGLYSVRPFRAHGRPCTVFTRRAIRDYYDLDALFARGRDFSSSAFVRLVDAKLAELEAPPLALQAPAFGMTDSERKRLGRAARDELAAVLPVDAPASISMGCCHASTLFGVAATDPKGDASAPDQQKKTTTTCDEKTSRRHPTGDRAGWLSSAQLTMELGGAP